MSLIDRLKARKLIPWTAAYLAAAWGALQVLSLLSDSYDWSPTVMRVAPVLLIGGALLVVVLAWYHGERGAQRFALLELVLVLVILVGTGAGAFMVGRAPDAADGDVASNDAGVASGKSVAVLPFVSLSSDRENAYFASGMHDELLTQLAQLSDLKVISRTSVMAYEGTRLTIKQIARQLGVATVMEGSVQRAGNRVRVQAQLIDASTDDHLWAARYDTVLTDVFAVQTDIAQQIATALKAQLSAGEREGMERRPTENADAYDSYMRGRQYDVISNFNRPALERAIEFYERAVRQDPQFAQAHARLSEMHGRMRWFGYDQNNERLELQRRHANKAIELNDQVPESHRAMGYYHYYSREYARAVAAFDKALQFAPGDSELLHAIALVRRREGKLGEAIEMFRKATSLDPRNAKNFAELGLTQAQMRNYDAALRSYDRALDIAPDDLNAAAERAFLILVANGDLQPARTFAAREDLPPGIREFVPLMRVQVAFVADDLEYAKAQIPALPEVIDNQTISQPRSLLVGMIHQFAGEHEQARRFYEESRIIQERRVRENPDDPRLLLGLAFSYAGLGRRADAVNTTQRVLAMDRVKADWPALMLSRVQASQIYAMAGANDEAIAMLQQLMREPSELSVHLLRLYPQYDGLRSDPRFAALLRNQGRVELENRNEK